MREQSYTDAFKENGAITDKNLMYREIGIVPETAAKCVLALMGTDYSHISIRNKRMYVYYHKAGSPSGVDLHDTFPLGCLAIAKALKGEIWDLSVYSDIVDGW